MFTAAELKAALPSAQALGSSSRITGTDLRPFGTSGGGDWGQCRASYASVREMGSIEGAGALQYMLSNSTGNEEAVTAQLGSMPAARASRYLELRRRLNRDCPEVAVDTEAAPVQEHHEAQRLAGLGDEALLEVRRQTGGDEYDGTPSYRVDVRVGGVLVVVESFRDRNAAVMLAALTARRVHSEIYGLRNTRTPWFSTRNLLSDLARSPEDGSAVGL
ncbi:hypothetical protein ACN2WE_40470 [Streptomyces sp. cg28]|uniref:hypothetical protein n=1 Tax=Streptomyces sp. cg28 TaxID=3403457 RepID=UPI003B221656